MFFEYLASLSGGWFMVVVATSCSDTYREQDGYYDGGPLAFHGYLS